MDVNTERVTPVLNTNINTFLDTLKASRTKGGIKDKDALSRLKDLKENPDLKQERKELEDGVFDRIDSLHPKLNSGINQEESDDLRFYLSLAYQLEMDNIAEVKQYLDAVKRALPEPEKKPEPKPKTVSRRRFISGLAAGIGIALAPQVLSTKTYSQDAQLTTPEPINIPKTPEEPTATKISTVEAKTPTIKPPESTNTSSPTQTETPTPSPTQIETTTPSPTPDAIRQGEKEAGTVNIAEYLFGKFIEDTKIWRKERFEKDPSFVERLAGLEGSAEEKKARAEKAISSDKINLVYLGIDETRERFNEFNGNGWGRSDVIMLISFDPHTMQTKSVSFPRDLFTPELTRFGFSGGARINATTMTPFVKSGENSHEIMRQILETATGLPIDGIVQTNIDFMQGWKENNDQPQPGIFDSLFPEGLQVDVKSRIIDNEYPVGYGIKKLEFLPGPQILKGRKITEYARTRHSDSDFGRADRQREILFSSIRALIGLGEDEQDKGIVSTIPLLKGTSIGKDIQKWINKGSLISEIIRGDTARFDKMIASLKYQQDNNNIIDDFGLVERLEEMRDGIKNLGKSPVGFYRLLTMGKNSKDLMEKLGTNPESIKSVGLTRGNGLISDANPNSRYHTLYMLQVAGANMDSEPTSLGNYMNYWKPLRNFLQQKVFN